MPQNPIDYFLQWFKLASSMPEKIDKPEHFVLSTCDNNGQPSARVLLFKGLKDSKFTFYTNYNSQKGKELIANPKAAMTFFWDPLGYQVRIKGSVEKMSRSESVKYFNSRPIDSQRAAIISQQSSAIPDSVSYEELEAKMKSIPVELIQCPEHWGGFELEPSEIEFWINGKNRFHQRIVYTKNDSATDWEIRRLFP